MNWIEYTFHHFHTKSHVQQPESLNEATEPIIGVEVLYIKISPHTKSQHQINIKNKLHWQSRTLGLISRSKQISHTSTLHVSAKLEWSQLQVSLGTHFIGPLLNGYIHGYSLYGMLYTKILHYFWQQKHL